MSRALIVLIGFLLHLDRLLFVVLEGDFVELLQKVLFLSYAYVIEHFGFCQAFIGSHPHKWVQLEAVFHYLHNLLSILRHFLSEFISTFLNWRYLFATVGIA